MVLLYYRSYSTQFFIGQFLGIDDSRVCRLIRQLEPLLAQVVPLPKKRTLSLQEVESLIVDATEQHIEGPKRNQKSYYSGRISVTRLKRRYVRQQKAGFYAFFSGPRVRIRLFSL